MNIGDTIVICAPVTNYLPVKRVVNGFTEDGKPTVLIAGTEQFMIREDEIVSVRPGSGEIDPEKHGYGYDYRDGQERPTWNKIKALGR